MFSRRSILWVFLFLARVLAHGADGREALERYNTRLDEIARSYRQQFAEIRKSQFRIGSEKADFRAGEQQIKGLGMMRSAAIAEAKLTYERELKYTEPAPLAQVSREQRQRELLAARRQLFEAGQKAFWTRVAREEPKVAELMAAQRHAFEEQQAAFWAGLPSRELQQAELMAAGRKAVEEEQSAFWSELFEASKAIPHGSLRMAAAQTGAQRSEKQTSPEALQRNAAVQVQYGRVLAAAN